MCVPPALRSICTQILVHQQPSLVRHVLRRFPTLCQGRAEDAVSEVYVLLCRTPDRFEAAFARDGAPGLIRLARRVARFAANDQIRRAAYCLEEGAAQGDPDGVRHAGQEVWASLPRDLPGFLREVAAGVCASRADALAGALHDKLETGRDDTSLASRHQVRREYINRAWGALAEALLAA